MVLRLRLRPTPTPYALRPWPWTYAYAYAPRARPRAHARARNSTLISRPPPGVNFNPQFHLSPGQICLGRWGLTPSNRTLATVSTETPLPATPIHPPGRPKPSILARAIPASIWHGSVR